MKWYNKFFRTIKTDLSFEEGMQIYNNNQALLIDVRTQEEYNKKHLDGAINVPVYDIESINNVVTNKNEVILLYCKSGERSTIAKETLMQNGYRNVYTIKARI